MPTQQTFYLNCPTLASATTVFLDPGLTTAAPDGYYYDGATARQQVGGVLLPAQACPTCGDECKGIIEDATSYEGVYTLTFDAGNTPTSTGAVIITFEVDNSIAGIKAVYDGVTYNAVSSPVYGYLAGTPSTAFTYIGDSLDCVTPGGSYTLDLYTWDETAYIPLGGTTSITVTAGEIQVTASSPGMCIMVIPKTNPTERYIDITIVGPCEDSKAILGVSCPLELPSFLGTYGVPTVSPEFFCNFPYNYTYYVAPVNGDGITLGLYDWVFLDSNGENVLPDGYYRALPVPAPFDTFQVQDGIIIAFHSYCAS
jgi:hypothetical protein